MVNLVEINRILQCQPSLQPLRAQVALLPLGCVLVGLFMEGNGVDRSIEPGGARGRRRGVLDLLEAHGIGKLMRFRKSEVLYCEGDPAGEVYVIKQGHVKTLGNSPEGKLHTYDILGYGQMVGVTGCLLAGTHESMAEALEETEAYAIQADDLDRLLVHDTAFSMAVMRELAQSVRSLTDKVRGLSMLDVQQRLRQSLIRLADEHGQATDRGVKIDFDITHEGLAELVAANRSTTTAYLNELKRQGFLWKEARRLVIIPPEHLLVLDGLSQAVLESDDQAAVTWARRAVDEGVSPFKALDVLTAAIRQVDRAFGRGKLALPDVVGAAFAMKCAMPAIEDEIKKTGIKVPSLAKVAIGTVRGDIHDIGKTMAATLMVAAGFDVVDLGVDVPPHRFVDAVRLHKPDILAMSALMSVTASEQGVVIHSLEEAGLRDKVKIMVGGGGVTRQLAERIQADGYEPTAQGAVELAVKLSSGHHHPR